MTLADRPLATGRIAALAILVVLIGLFCIGPLAAYCNLVGDNSDALATKEAMLQRYRALATANPAANPPAAAGPALLYPDMPESQASALLQETVKNVAVASHIQVQGLQVLHSETQPGVIRIGVRVRGSGDIASLRSLIYAIEAARPALYADNLTIQSHATPSGSAPNTLDFQLDIAGFKTKAGS